MVENDENRTSRHRPKAVSGGCELLDSAGEEVLADDALELAERVNLRMQSLRHIRMP
jgi:hypothetical protein